MDSKDNHKIDACYRLLAICARTESYPNTDEQLIRFAKSFTAWDELPKQAELHGMSPLLWHHIQRLNISIPSETKKMLNALYLRHRVLHQAHTQVLLEVTALLEQKNIRAVVLKGLALAHEYYPDPVLRPASDIDLLLKKEDILPALDLLRNAGYHTSSLQTDLKLLPKELTVSSPVKNGLSTRIELHHYDPQGKSAIDNSPDDEFFGFDKPPHAIKIGEQMIYVPDPMNHLDYLVRHLTRHLFVATNENPLLLKWIADIICLVERHAETINWVKHKSLLNRLEVIYSLTPFPEHLSQVIPIKKIQPPNGLNQYPQGWPQQVFREWKRGGFWSYIKYAVGSPSYIWHTLKTPSTWWLRLQYGINEKNVFWYGLFVYRRQVLRMAFAKLMRAK